MDGDVADGHVSDRPLEGAVVRVPVEDEVGPVGADRPCQAAGAEEGPDRLGLADQGPGHRRVVHEHDPPVAARDRLQARPERVDLDRRLPVHLAQQRLAEVRNLRAGEAADEPLAADDADVGPVEVEDERLALERPHARGGEHGDDLGGPARVVVVIPEHREHGHPHRPARVGEHRRLLGQPVRHQVARQEHEVDGLVQPRERRLQPGPERLGGMDVARGGDADRTAHGSMFPAAAPG